VANRKYILIGRILDDADLQQFPEGAKFSYKQTRDWKVSAPADLMQAETLHHLDRLSLLMVNSITLQCPIGPHDDPGLEVAVARACNISRTGSVAVQCSKGHWAEYPCG
jgi:hypothetical protein